jgi:hypothetical protein
LIHYFCFYNVSTGVQAKLSFSQVFRHCNVIGYDGAAWIVTDFDRKGYHMEVVEVPSAGSLIRGLKHVKSLSALIVVDVDEKASVSWKPFMVRSCNEIARYLSGVNIGFTFNPKHLYNKLLKYNGSNYEVLHVWRR